jgi:hypothetical protein
MSIKTSNFKRAENIGNQNIPTKDGDAKDSIESQLANLESLHDHEGKQSEDQDDLFNKTGHKGGLHSSAALSAHLEKYHGPKFAGSSK